MGKRITDMTGKKYGMLTALYPTERKSANGGYFWMFKCDCGRLHETDAAPVRSGKVVSCGCKKYKHGDGYKKTRLYNIWCAMRMRCKKDGDPRHKYWGGKGISVCDEWQEYTLFKAWALENGYKDNLTIERIDSNKDYTPSNCRWATYKEQARNLSSNRLITINGETHPLVEWCEILGGVTTSQIYYRMRVFGWDIEKSLTTPPMRKRKEARNGNK